MATVAIEPAFAQFTDVETAFRGFDGILIGRAFVRPGEIRPVVIGLKVILRTLPAHTGVADDIGLADLRSDDRAAGRATKGDDGCG